MLAEIDDATFEYLANPNPSALEDRSRLEVLSSSYFRFFPTKLEVEGKLS